MLSAFFIDRPKFAFVISIVITLAGVIALIRLPVAEFPDISPPQVRVTASYPGASAQVVEETVAAPIEAQVNGVDDMMYMSSTSANDGSYVLNVTFEIGTDPDIAAVNVQNRVALALPSLPEEVSRRGVSTKKQSTNMLMVVNLFSPGQTYDAIFLSNYAAINLRDAIVRLPGVGDATIMGSLDYGMRIWLDPDRLTALGLSTQDVIAALRDQNVQVAAGQIGAEPAPAADEADVLALIEQTARRARVGRRCRPPPGRPDRGGGPAAGGGGPRRQRGRTRTGGGGSGVRREKRRRRGRPPANHQQADLRRGGCLHPLPFHPRGGFHGPQRDPERLRSDAGGRGSPDSGGQSPL